MIQFSSSEGPYALTGALIFDGGGFRSGLALEIAEGRVKALTPLAALPADLQRLDLPGQVIAPGFVDLQLNGCGGLMFNDHIEMATLDAMHAANLKSGCTSFLPTLVSSTDDDMRRAMAVVARFRAERGNHSVIGLHLEGPYINKERKGIHNEAMIREMTPEMLEVLADFADATPLMLTLAPERVPAEYIAKLLKAGVVVSLGHSAATYEEAKLAVRAGVRCATHLFNAMSHWESREPGLVGAVFDSPSLHCGMIVDGHHSHFASVSLAKRLKGHNCFLVTDATAPVGTNMTEFNFCGQTVYVRDGKCVNADGTLGGSYLTMMGAVANGIAKVGWTPAETLSMAALYPARMMGLDRALGRVAPGCPANLAIFSPFTLELAATVDRGQVHMWRPPSR